MRDVEPWTEVASWQWRPQFDFEERRIPFLREVDQAGVLEAWHLQRDAVGVIVDEPGCEIFIAQDRLAASTPESRLPDVAMDVLAMVERVFEPVTSSVWIAHQYVIPLAREYDVARTELGDKLWPGTFSALGGTDFALLFDGVAAASGSQYQIEFGVVLASELADRLARTVGRSAFRGVQVPAPERLTHPPDVSLFVDVHWNHSSDHLQAAGFTRPSRELVDAHLAEEQDLVQTVLTGLGVDAAQTTEDNEP